VRKEFDHAMDDIRYFAVSIQSDGGPVLGAVRGEVRES
jgi:hypothetical protein